MSQHDFDIANQTFPNTRSDLNLALKALASTSSGTSAPSTTFANQLWYDSSANILYIRNEDNDANITIMALDQANDTVEYFKSDSIRTALIEFTDGDDALSIADGGALTTSGNLSIGGSNNELRFYEGANYVGFEAPALSADKIWVLPSADGSANQTLTTNGSGTLSFGTLPVAGGGTGATTITANGVVIGNGTGALTAVDLSTKGKILIGDGSGNPQALAVGTNDHVLTADSSEATGVKWASAGGGGGGLAVVTAVNQYNAASPYASYSYTGFSSSYDNYLVLVHAISLAGDGDVNFQWLDDGSALTGGGYRIALNGIDSNATDRQLASNNETSPRIFDDLKGGDNAPFSGFMYMQLGRGGRWDSDSSDSEGNVRPMVTCDFVGKDHSNYARSVHGGFYYDDAAGNTMNGFKLTFGGGGANKVCLTVYGVVRS
tara:strand:+ start:14428 stop:15729 length:1302 start_codon:yes stop_codon:yes gene_type:complete